MSLLLTLGTFGASFVMRPLGALVMGVYSDRFGRKAALTLSILLMMCGTLMIAVMPTHASIGVLAPAGIVLARLIQGFSAGGEFGSATAFLAEQSRTRRGFFSSWQVASQGVTTILAAGFGALLTGTLSAQQLESWGWRVPFLFGLLIGPVAYYIRTQIDETPEFLAAQKTETPLADTFTNQKERLFVAIGLATLATVGAYVTLYMPTYAIRQLGIPSSAAFSATIVQRVMLLVFAPIVGSWSDRKGRIGIMKGAAVLIALLAYPAFYLLESRPTFGAMIAVMVGLGGLMAAYYGALPALLSELFPVQVRTTGMALGYNLAVTVFGGFAPFILTWLVASTGNKLAPSFYVIFAALLSLAALMRARQRMGMK